MAELTKFVYLVDGEPYVGTISDYAKAVVNGNDLSVDVSEVVWTFADGKPTYHLVRFNKVDNEGYASVWVEFAKDDPEVATIRYN